MACETKAIERARLQLPLEQRDGVVRAEDPCIQTGLGADGIERRAEGFRRQRREEGSLSCKEQLGRLLACDFIERKPCSKFAGKFRGAKLAGGEIEQGEADAIVCGVHRREIVVALRTLRRVE